MLRALRRVELPIEARTGRTVIGVTETRPGQDTSFVATALAGILTFGGRETLLVHAARQDRPAGDAALAPLPDLSDASRAPGLARLATIHSRPAGPLETLSYRGSYRFDVFLIAAHESFDAVVIDLPLGDAAAGIDPGGRRIDAMVLIVDPRRTKAGEMVRAQGRGSAGSILDRAFLDWHGALRVTGPAR